MFNTKCSKSYIMWVPLHMCQDRRSNMANFKPILMFNKPKCSEYIKVGSFSHVSGSDGIYEVYVNVTYFDILATFDTSTCLRSNK